MKKTFLVFALAFVSFSAISAKTKTEKIKELMYITNSGDMGVMMIDRFIEHYSQLMSDVPATFWEEFRKEISSEGLIDIVVPIYDKHLTEAEIDELLRFYKTPVGSKFVQTLPAIYQESYEAGAAFGEELGQKVYTKLVQSGLIPAEEGAGE